MQFEIPRTAVRGLFIRSLQGEQKPCGALCAPECCAGIIRLDVNEPRTAVRGISNYITTARRSEVDSC